MLDEHAGESLFFTLTVNVIDPEGTTPTGFGVRVTVGFERMHVFVTVTLALPVAEYEV